MGQATSFVLLDTTSGTPEAQLGAKLIAEGKLIPVHNPPQPGGGGAAGKRKGDDSAGAGGGASAGAGAGAGGGKKKAKKT